MRKHSIIHMHGLSVLFEGRTLFCMGLISRTLQIFTYLFNRLYCTQCLTSFSSIDHLLCLYAWLFILFHQTDEVLLIKPSANVFVFGEFNVHHKGWLTYSGGTDRPGELCYNFSILYDLTQIVNFPTWIFSCDSHSPALWDLFLSSDTIICSTICSTNSDHFAFVSIWKCECYKKLASRFWHVLFTLTVVPHLSELWGSKKICLI